MRIKTTHKMCILKRLLKEATLISLDLGNVMSNPNKHFNQLKKDGFIGERTQATSQFKIRYLLPNKRKKVAALLKNKISYKKLKKACK
ncbi:MAG: hypothetical protein LBJ88_04330 [Campylobacteraceae bacterium]|jgi:hypothetical protein|nr:hypothetical protein [Campylobacteraceae bacterium]